MRVTARSSATGVPAYSDSFPRLPSSAPEARRLVRRALNTWHLGPLQESADLIVTELVANAVEHARLDTIRVSVTRVGARTVRISVIDRDRAQPTPRYARPEDEHGRGLTVVAALSRRWGTELLHWGKRVWAEVGDAS